MAEHQQTPSLVRFGVFEVNLATGELRRSGTKVAMQEQPFRLLASLLERPGELVTREELQQRIWPEDTFVDFDRSLNTAVMKIRQALGDSASHPRFLETIPRRGYRFLAPVEIAGTSQGLDPQLDQSPAPKVGTITFFQRRRRLAFSVVAGLAVIVPAAWIAFSRRTDPPMPDWIIRPVTRFAGEESAPSWSPDGQMIAFSRMAPGDANIFIMPLAGGEPVQLTSGPADDMRPRWSPDGRYIAFLSDEGRTKRVYLMTPLGGARRLLADTGLSYLHRFGDAWMSFGAVPWSPDGRELLYSQLQPNGRIAIWKVRVETNVETQVTYPPQDCDDQLATWSFDGRWIAFSRQERGKSGLWLVPAEGGEPRILLRDEYDNYSPAFSSDGRKIVFVSTRAGGNSNIWDIDIASRRLRRLIRSPSRQLNPVVSRQGGLLFADHAFDMDLYRMDLASGVDQRLTRDNDLNYHPNISPDGERIAYYSARSGNFDIWLLDLRSGSQRRLTTDPAADLVPDWSPDGRELVFLSNRDGSFRLWVIDPERGTTRCLMSQPVHMAQGQTVGTDMVSPRWSPDGRSIAFIAATENGFGLWSVDRDGSRLTRLLSDVAAFDWYRDARHVVYSRTAKNATQEDEIRLADLDTGEEVLFYRGGHRELSAARDGRGITFIAGPSYFALNLFLMPIGGLTANGLPHPLGKARRMTDSQGLWYARNGNWSPDCKFIAYARQHHNGDIYLIENYR